MSSSLVPSHVMAICQPPSCEFGLELVGILPALHARAVNHTCSLPGTAAWYHWSDSHTEISGSRGCAMLRGDWPIASLHTCSRTPPSLEEWAPPPMMTPARYREAKRLWALVEDGGRAPVVVHNKICDEWGGGPVHRIPDDVLTRISRNVMSSGARVLYVRPDGGETGYSRDQNLIAPCVTSDYRAIEAQGGVTLQTVMERAGVDYNTAQVTLSCLANDFISVQGGSAIVASYFGGRNLIYAKRGLEVRRRLYDHDSVIAALSNCSLRVVGQASDLPRLWKRKSVQRRAKHDSDGNKVSRDGGGQQ